MKNLQPILTKLETPAAAPEGALREVSMRITKATVVLTTGTDMVCLDVDLPTPFPEMGYPATMCVHTRYNYGKTWCESALGITPEVVARPQGYVHPTN